MSSAPKIQEPSMEDILASIRRIIADDHDSPSVSAQPSQAAEERPDQDGLDPAETGIVPQRARSGFEHEEMSFRGGDNQVDFDAIPTDEEPHAPPPANAFPDEVPPKVTAQADTLLSSEAQASVAGALRLLSSTIVPAHPRTVEDLMKELLRPMLREWLDQNLPALVERLVKAEIERVARGS